jgi:hypothetical protein
MSPPVSHAARDLVCMRVLGGVTGTLNLSKVDRTAMFGHHEPRELMLFALSQDLRERGFRQWTNQL